MPLLNTHIRNRIGFLERYGKKCAQISRHSRVIAAEPGFRKRWSTAKERPRNKGHSLQNASSTRWKPVPRRHFSSRLPETGRAFRGQMALEFIRNSSRHSVGFPERRSNTPRTFDLVLTETFSEWDAPVPQKREWRRPLILFLYGESSSTDFRPCWRPKRYLLNFK